MKKKPEQTPEQTPQHRPVQTMARFARTRVRICPGLGEDHDFPRDLWTEMGRLGLLDPDAFCPDLFSPDSFSEGAAPVPGTFQILTRTVRALVREGGNLGLALSWIIHHLTSRRILGTEAAACFGRDSDPDLDLNQMLKTGAATLSFALSEPKGGGHPKSISTRAEKEGEGWVMSGEKCYLTNGPLARAFVVIAVTGQDGDKKEFSAFLVDRDAPGLRLMPAMKIPFFKPSPHGGILLDNCRVGPDALVGTLGRAYPDLVLGFRQEEDVLMTGAVTGAMAFLLQALAVCPGHIDQADPAFCESLGGLAAMGDAAQAISDRAATDADLGRETLQGCHLFFRELASGFIERVDAFLADYNLILPRAGQIVLKDLKASADLGRTVSRLRLRKLGQTLSRSANK